MTLSELVRKKLELDGFNVEKTGCSFFNYLACRGNVTLCVDASGRPYTQQQKSKAIEYAKYIHAVPVVAKVKKQLFGWPKIELDEVR